VGSIFGDGVDPKRYFSDIGAGDRRRLATVVESWVPAGFPQFLFRRKFIPYQEKG